MELNIYLSKCRFPSIESDAPDKKIFLMAQDIFDFFIISKIHITMEERKSLSKRLFLCSIIATSH